MSFLPFRDEGLQIRNQLILQGFHLKLMLEALLYLADRLFSLVFGRLGAEASGTHHNRGVSTVHDGTSHCDGGREGGVADPVVGGRV